MLALVVVPLRSRVRARRRRDPERGEALTPERRARLEQF
jgi:hypothetical protein